MKTQYNCKGHISITNKENKYDVVKVEKKVFGDITEASDDFSNLLKGFMKNLIDQHGKENVDTSYISVKSVIMVE